MGVYACTLQRNKTLTLKLVDGSEVRVAQTKYLCRASQLDQTEWTEKGEKLVYPQLMGAVTRIENALEKLLLQANPFTADFVNIVSEPYSMEKIDGAYIHKLERRSSVNAVYYDDRPSGVEKQTYMVIKTPEGFVILELDFQKNFNFIKENEYLWNYRLDTPIHVRVNEHYTASCYTLRSMYEYLTDHGKGQADRDIYVKGSNLHAPQWFINALEFMCLHEKIRVRSLEKTSA